MVRVGGGWDTLEHYLDKHDPCRCSSTGQCPRQRRAGRGLISVAPPLTCHLCLLSWQPIAHPSQGPVPSPLKGCHLPPAPELVAQPQGLSAGAPGLK